MLCTVIRLQSWGSTCLHWPSAFSTTERWSIISTTPPSKKLKRRFPAQKVSPSDRRLDQTAASALEPLYGSMTDVKEGSENQLWHNSLFNLVVTCPGLGLASVTLLLFLVLLCRSSSIWGSRRFNVEKLPWRVTSRSLGDVSKVGAINQER